MAGIWALLRSGSGQLVFPHDAFMAVSLALDPVLEDAGVFGQQANHLELSAGGADLVPIGREADGLSDRKFGCCHHGSYRMFLPATGGVARFRGGCQLPFSGVP